MFECVFEFVLVVCCCLCICDVMLNVSVLLSVVECWFVLCLLCFFVVYLYILIVFYLDVVFVLLCKCDCIDVVLCYGFGIWFGVVVEKLMNEMIFLVVSFVYCNCDGIVLCMLVDFVCVMLLCYFV